MLRKTWYFSGTHLSGVLELISGDLSLQASHGDGVHGHQERELYEDGCCRNMDGRFCDGVDGEPQTRTCLKSSSLSSFV